MNILYLNNQNDNSNYCTISNVNIPFSQMSFDTWFYVNQKSGTVISQDNGIEISIKDISIILKHPALKEIEITLDESVMPVNVWKHLFVMYDGNKLALALNGITIYEENVGSLQLLSSKDIYLGKYMSGGFQNFRLYSKYIPFEQINQYILAPCQKEKLPDVQLYVDFTPRNGIQKMPSSLVFGESRYVVSKCFSGLETGESGIVQDENRDNKSLCSQQFTVYAKLYLDEKLSLKEKEYILLHQSQTQNSDFEMYFVLNQVHQYNLQFTISGKQYSFSKIFGPSQWFDIMVTYSSNSLVLYVDAKKTETIYDVSFTPLSPGVIKIGNNPQEKQTSLDGYISYIAMFSKSLGIADAEYFYENGIYIFEDGIDALYDFSKTTANLTEFVHFKKITSINNAKIFTNISSNFKEITDKYRISKSIANLNEEQAKQAETIVDIILDYSKTVFGIEATGTSEQKKMVGALLYNQYHDSDEWNNVFDEPESADSKKILALLITFSTAGLFLVLGVMGGSAGSLLVDAIFATIAEALLGSFSLTGIFAVAAVAAIIACLIMACFEEEYPNYNSIQILLNKGAFNTNPKDYQVSGISIYKSYEDKTLAADWNGTNNSANCSNIAYIKSKISNRAVLNFELSIVNSKDLKDATFDLHIENNSFFGSYIIKNLPASGGIINRSLTLDRNTLADAHVGTTKQEIKWWAMLSGNNKRDFGTSYHDVHIIKDIPVSPWDLEKENCYPNVDALNLFNTLYKNKENTDILSELSENIYAFESFKARCDNSNSYSNVMMMKCDGFDTNIVFDAKRFVTDFKAKTMKSLSSLDTSLLLTDLTRLQGILNVNPVCLEQNLGYKKYNGYGNVDTFNPEMFTLKNVKLIGEEGYTPSNQKLWRHYVVSQNYVDKKYDFICYDSFIKVKSAESADISLNNKPFSLNDFEFISEQNNAYYRESLFPVSSFCEIMYMIDQYAKTDVTYPEISAANNLQKAVTGQRPFNNVEYIRPKFLAPVLNKYFENNDAQICHFISFDTMFYTLYNCVNAIYESDDPIIKNEYITLVDNFILTVTGDEDDETNGLNNIRVNARNKWIDIKNNYIGPNTIVNLDKVVRELLVFLNSCGYNLRLGDSSWNHAIQDALDVEKWCYVIRDKQNKWVVLSSYLNFFSVPMRFEDFCDQAVYKRLPDPVDQGFYIMNTSPNQRKRDYEFLCNKQQNIDSIYLNINFLMAQLWFENIGARPFLYSSSNLFPKPKNNDKSLDKQIYYLSQQDLWRPVY